jgi:succinyl-diaminopimelate desuccinylase
METIEILKQIISIPSWVDETTNEEKLGTWIINFLSSNTKLKISQQNVGGGRFNIIATNSNKINTLVTGHIDTVRPNSGWTKSPIKPEITGERLYGLGSTDMKSGIAVMLSLATRPNLKNNTCFLFYCDEEYDFLGMKKFVQEYQSSIKPRLIISLDGEGLQIGNSCRGLIEMKVIVDGKAGHSANPKSGINAITESFKVINKLERWVSSSKSNELGNSTLNIACINGGGSEGNIIADNCEYIVEIRVANDKLNANLVKDFIIKESETLGLKTTNIKVRHDLGNWITKNDDLKDYIKLSPNKKLKSAEKSGYIDIQMLWQTTGKVPTFSFGIGDCGMSHKANEYITIPNIFTSMKFFEKLLTN